VILYHGTTEDNAKSILEQGIIKATAVRLTHGNNPIMSTQRGYVYLTNKAYLGFYYSMIGDSIPEKTLYVFKIELDGSALLADKQEIKTILAADYVERKYTVEESLKISSAVRIDSDLHLNKEVLCYGTIPYSMIKPSNLVKEMKQKAINRKQADDIDLSKINWVNF
jgi:hypothetical protein